MVLWQINPCRLFKAKFSLFIYIKYLPKEILTAILMLYKNTKAKLCSPDGNVEIFEFILRVLQGYTLVLFFAYDLLNLRTLNINISYKRKLFAGGVMVIVVGNGHGDTSSNP